MTLLIHSNFIMMHRKYCAHCFNNSARYGFLPIMYQLVTRKPIATGLLNTTFVQALHSASISGGPRREIVKARECALGDGASLSSARALSGLGTLLGQCVLGAALSTRERGVMCPDDVCWGRPNRSGRMVLDCQSILCCIDVQAIGAFRLSF
jgi:hypothetical protein